MHTYRLSLLITVLASGCAAAGSHEEHSSAASESAPETLVAHAPGSPHDRPGYVTLEHQGRLWVFREESAELASFRTQGEPAKNVTLVGQGPGGISLRGVDRETLDAYLLAKPGFATALDDGRLWVFPAGSPSWQSFLENGPPAKSVTRVSQGPGGISIRAEELETIQAYLTARPGFATALVDGRVWVSRADSEDWTAFQAQGEPAKSVTRVGAGPTGLSLRASDAETIDAYLHALEGFEVAVKDGRLWVFRAGSADWHSFLQAGEPAKSVTRVGQGPGGRTIRAVDGETIDAYLAAWRRAHPNAAMGQAGRDEAASTTPAAAPRRLPVGPADKPGFVTFHKDGRLWIFEDDAPEAYDMVAGREPAKSVTRVTPTGTFRALQAETILAYAATRPGFETVIVDGRIWVFRAGAPEAEALRNGGTPSARRVVRIGAGPLGATVMALDTPELDEYLAWKPGFVVRALGNVRWIFPEGSPDLVAHDTRGPSARSVTRVTAGGSLRAVDAEVLDAYAVAAEGFAAFLRDGRIYVFEHGSADHTDFLQNGPAAKDYRRVAAGPGGRTVIGPEESLVQRYLATVR
jgi:hypothetical protein